MNDHMEQPVAPVQATTATGLPETVSDKAMALKPRVVIVGAGFGGLQAARAFKDAPVQLTVIDRPIITCFSRSYIKWRPPVYRRPISPRPFVAC
jgi:hypothetical protein